MNTKLELQITTGGEVPAFGREAFIQQLWETLKTQGFQLLGERRTGKTTVVKAMNREPRAGFQAIYLDCEGLKTPTEFVEAVATKLEEYLPGDRRMANLLREVWTKLAGTEISGLIKIPTAQAGNWKIFLERTLQALEANLESGDRFVFFLDEVPLLLSNIVGDKAQGERVAMELIDTLRALRQRENTPIRMVFTGSIGLHHVLTGLRDAGHKNDPVNDLDPITLPTLTVENATQLAQKLAASFPLPCGEADAAYIAEQTDGLPFYIQWVVKRLGERRISVTKASVDTVIGQLLTDPQDPMHLRYYEERIESYYGARAPLAFAALDAVAMAGSSVPFHELTNAVRHKEPEAKDRELRGALDWLQQDHYLLNKNSAFEFSHGLIRRAWRILRYLEGQA
jgi:hypothetical protein